MVTMNYSFIDFEYEGKSGSNQGGRDRGRADKKKVRSKVKLS